MIEIQTLKTFATGISRFADLLYAPDVREDLFFAFRDALSRGQLESKVHLLELAIKYEVPMDKTFFIGHWHGLLPYLFLQSKLVRVGMGIELNPVWKRRSEKICAGLSWNSLVGDARQLGREFYSSESFDCVVNTSCEHMGFEWLMPIPAKTFIIAQANDYQISEHTHPQSSLKEFEANLNLSKVIETDEIEFGVYRRFTVVGIK
jgi:hypothetical protein